MALFAFEELTFRYPEAPRDALHDVSVAIEPGQFVLVCGQSGCGKTTLLRQFKSALAPHGHQSGRVLFDGVPLVDVPECEQVARIGFVMQNPDAQIVTDKVWHELASSWKVSAATSAPCACAWRRWPAISASSTGSIRTWASFRAVRNSC